MRNPLKNFKKEGQNATTNGSVYCNFLVYFVKKPLRFCGTLKLEPHGSTEHRLRNTDLTGAVPVRFKD